MSLSTWRRPSGLRSAGLTAFAEASAVKKSCATLIAGGCLALAALGGLSAQSQPSVVAIRGGTILTVTKGTIQNGTVLLRDGKIAAVGTNVSIPSGAEVVDAAGKFISPGIIDCHSHIAAD